MRVNVVSIAGLRFYCRPNTSDAKAVREVVEKRSYLQRKMTIEPGEVWLDLGANVGAFSVMAVAAGAAHVQAYEPDPQSAMICRRNFELNEIPADRALLHEKAVTVRQNDSARLNVSKTGQYWRNSLEHSWGGPVVEVKTESIETVMAGWGDVADTELCVKMDIEGSEMPLLEMWRWPVKKLVFEWSFDIDPDIDRYRKVIDRLRTIFGTVKADSLNPDVRWWPKNWFPPARMVYCWREVDEK